MSQTALLDLTNIHSYISADSKFYADHCWRRNNCWQTVRLPLRGVIVRLWHLLIGICFAAPLGSALAPAAGAGIAGYALALATGLAVGASCSWIMWWMHKALVPSLLRRLEEADLLSEWYVRAFYVSKVLWIMFAGFLGFWLSSALLHMVV